MKLIEQARKVYRHLLDVEECSICRKNRCSGCKDDLDESLEVFEKLLKDPNFKPNSTKG